ncbi:hypothetical protein BGX26_009304 [Mortierella sp. AD094]|nr:hypothetical protein BGX26_009304 [Mortierella sp. AD094]
MSNNHYYSGTNSQGNHYCNRGESTAPGGSYHYSNTNGSYYYQNSNGSTYYSNPNTGYKSYTPPGQSRSSSNGGSRGYSGYKTKWCNAIFPSGELGNDNLFVPASEEKDVDDRSSSLSTPPIPNLHRLELRN